MTNASNVATASKDVLETALATMIEKATAGVEQGVSFLSAQLPDVIHQLLLWELVSNVVLGLILILPAVVALISFRKTDFRDEEKVANYVFGVSALLTVFTLPFAVMNFMTALKVWLAPKLFLIEFAANLIK